MTREMVTRAFGWKSMAVAGVLLVTIVAGAPAARQRPNDGPADGARAPMPNASDSRLLRSHDWLRTVRDDPGGPTVAVRLDDVLGGLGRGVVLDRPALGRVVREVVGSDEAVDGLRVGELLDRVPRVRVSSQGLSMVIGRRTLTQIVQHVAGRGGVDDMTVGEVLDGVAGAQLTHDGMAGLLDQDATTSLLGAILPGAQRVDHSRDAQARRRQALQRLYGRVVDLVRQVRREGFADADRNAVYEEAHKRLLAERQLAAIPLLDGHLRLEEELAAAQVGTSSRAERIASRWEARRKAFGAQVVEMLFSRDEAMERYEVDRLALAADLSLSDEDRARKLGERRQALKVELAAQGSYVSFPDEARDAPDLAAAGEGRPR